MAALKYTKTRLQTTSQNVMYCSDAQTPARGSQVVRTVQHERLKYEKYGTPFSA